MAAPHQAIARIERFLADNAGDDHRHLDADDVHALHQVAKDLDLDFSVKVQIIAAKCGFCSVMLVEASPTAAANGIIPPRFKTW